MLNLLKSRSLCYLIFSLLVLKVVKLDNHVGTNNINHAGTNNINHVGINNNIQLPSTTEEKSEQPIKIEEPKQPIKIEESMNQLKADSEVNNISLSPKSIPKSIPLNDY